MSTLIEPANSAETEGEQSPLQDWRDDGSEERRGGRGVVRSASLIVVGSVAVGIAAAAIIGVRFSRRRKSKTLLRWTAAHAEDARDALAHAAAGLPERGRAAMRRVRR